jgi:hypothetical protein
MDTAWPRGHFIMKTLIEGLMTLRRVFLLENFVKTDMALEKSNSTK